MVSSRCTGLKVPFLEKVSNKTKKLCQSLCMFHRWFPNIVMAVGKQQRLRLFSVCSMLCIHFSSCWVNLLWRNCSFAALAVSLFHIQVNVLTSADKNSLYLAAITHAHRGSCIHVCVIYCYAQIYMCVCVCVRYVCMDVIYKIIKYDSDWKE